MPSVQQITAATNIRSEFLAKRFRLDIFIEHVRDLLINANIPIIHDTHGYNQNIIP